MSNANGLRIKRFACIMVAMLGSAIVSAAEPPDFIVTFPDGIACKGFALTVEGWGGKQHTKVFEDKKGIPRLFSAGTGAAMRYTNETTKATFSSQSNGSVTHTTINPDGSLTQDFMGHTVLILFPTDIPAGPSTTLYTGRFVIRIDSSGITTLQTASGHKIDICAAVS